MQQSFEKMAPSLYFVRLSNFGQNTRPKYNLSKLPFYGMFSTIMKMMFQFWLKDTLYQEVKDGLAVHFYLRGLASCRAAFLLKKIGKQLAPSNKIKFDT